MKWQWALASVLSGLLALHGGCAAVPPCTPVETVVLPTSQAPPVIAEPAISPPPIAPTESAATLALERKVKSQEKRIAELSSQLRMLKRIDLERTKPSASP
jgi:hypothetical protein